jgi:hypothetical protein
MSSNINKYNLKAKTRVSRISHSEDRIFEYIDNIRMMDKMTAKEYYARLKFQNIYRE